MENISPQLRQLVNKLRDELRLIGESLNQLHGSVSLLINAIEERKNSNNAQDKANEKPVEHPILVTVNPDVAITVEAETRERKSNGQKLFRALEIVGIVSVIVYAGLTYKMWREMKNANTITQNTFTEIQKQTKLIRQQVVGSQEAVVTIADAPDIGPQGLTADNVTIVLKFANSGHVVANDFNLRTTLQLVSTENDKPIGRVWPCKHTIQTLAPNQQPFIKKCFVQGLDLRDSIMIRRRKWAINISGEYTYDNGFGDSKREPLCWRYSPAFSIPERGIIAGTERFVTCDDFAEEQEYIRQQNAKQ